MNAEILLLEEDLQEGAALRPMLEAADFTVDLVQDGITALRLAKRHPYKAFLMVLADPGPKGRRVCSELRRYRVETPILMLTAKDDEHDEVTALDAGADDYLRKPCSHQLLLARLHALIRRNPRPANRTLRIGDLWLDRVSHRCGRGKRDISLTPREFAVLGQLAQHAGEVVSKTEILDEVWDMAYNGNPAIVEAYISMLRRKIDTPFGVSSIETVRGAGYRLVPADG